jgi:hypothetical protein
MEDATMGSKRDIQRLYEISNLLAKGLQRLELVVAQMLKEREAADVKPGEPTSNHDTQGEQK